MPHKLKPGKMYRMPIHFGPTLGPRQGEGDRKFNCLNDPKSTTTSVSFLTSRAQLEDLLPEGFVVGEKPIVTVSAISETEIEWLAGRGYNMLGVSFPAVFHGEEDHVTGDFRAVLWEDLADPIITGREELGFSKLYCELPEPRFYHGEKHFTASWMGFKFMDMKIKNLEQMSPQDISEFMSKKTGDGQLHYKYIPKTGSWGEAEVAHAVLTPAEDPNRVVEEMWQAEGTLQFHRATWEDLPTMFNIVNALCDLEIKEYCGASITKTVGGRDYSDQRILR